ncbi:MAG: ROK family protein [Chromatiaceae bacterium]|nr:ROK family protein [Chromatiaceae bacterium]MCP5306625.1 ROK family protein [Chromatiaceae bacterium]MCP5421874.1 ROK family protein [Chromatiaceae bacterium]
MTSLAADIGGTYSRLAWLDERRPTTEQVYENACFDSLESVIQHGRDAIGLGEHAIDRMVLAVPGPVQRDPIELTNINWRLSRDVLRQRFRVNQLTLVNDFQAAALGAIMEPYEHLTVLNPGSPDEGPVVVTGAGTGLGMAWMARRDENDLPQATEGGHIDFAPSGTDQVALHGWLAERYGHVSYERILSGDGLLDVYRWRSGNAGHAGSPAEVSALVDTGDKHATRAVRLFVEIFAAYAGNLALAFNPSAGIYLCGGLTAHLACHFDTATFLNAFGAKGRMSDVVRRVPVYLITRPNTGLTGAIRIANRTAASPWR